MNNDLLQVTLVFVISLKIYFPHNLFSEFIITENYFQIPQIWFNFEVICAKLQLISCEIITYEMCLYILANITPSHYLIRIMVCTYHYPMNATCPTNPNIYLIALTISG